MNQRMNFIGIGLGVLGAVCMAMCFYTDFIDPVKTRDIARGVYDASIFCVALTGIILGILNVRARKREMLDRQLRNDE